jgi:hypothetical protein
MICTKCHSDGIENQALGKTFWYCRTCKDEILPEKAYGLDANLVCEACGIGPDDARHKPGCTYLESLKAPYHYFLSVDTSGQGDSFGKVIDSKLNTWRLIDAIKTRILGDRYE